MGKSCTTFVIVKIVRNLSRGRSPCQRVNHVKSGVIYFSAFIYSCIRYYSYVEPGPNSFILGDRYRRDFLQAPRRRRICFKKIMTSHETRHPPPLTNIISFVTLLFFLSLWFFSSLIFCFPVFTRTFVTFLKQINGKKNLEPVRLDHRKRRSRQKEKLIIKKKKKKSARDWRKI